MKLLELNGYEIIKDVINHDVVESLRTEADRIAHEEGSVCVRRLRDKSNIFLQLATSDRLLDLLPQDFIPVRSILFDKTPDENWPVAWHQDLSIAVQEKIDVDGYAPWSIKDGIPHVQPPVSLLEKMLTIRIHLDDTPETNGALRVIAGSHLKGKIPANETKLYTSDPEKEDVCACGAGDVLLMRPLILHASSRSQKPARRRIIHFEYAPSNALDERLAWYENKLY